MHFRKQQGKYLSKNPIRPLQNNVKISKLKVREMKYFHKSKLAFYKVAYPFSPPLIKIDTKDKNLYSAFV